MNIFVLDINPILAAQYQCDKHVVKMCLETAQILCTVREKDNPPYKPTHRNHPCTIWARSSIANYNWLKQHLRALLDEYTFRYHKLHACEKIYNWLKVTPTPDLPQLPLTSFALAMPDQYKTNCPVQSYRNYYIGAKSNIAAWRKSRSKPDWYSYEF